MRKRKKFMRKFFRRGKSKRRVDIYDKYVKDDILAATKRGKLLLGLDDEALLAHPSLVYALPALKAKLVFNKDRVRFDLSHFHTLYFDEETLYYYNTIINHKIKGNHSDTALELPYKQIKAIETSLKFVKINNRPHHVFELVLRLDSLNNINVPLKMLAYDSKTPKEAYLIDQELLDMVSSLKQFLRAKMA